MDLSLSSDEKQVLLHALGCAHKQLMGPGQREQSQFYRNRYFCYDLTSPWFLVCSKLREKGLLLLEKGDYGCFNVTEKGIESILSKKEMEFRRRIRNGDDVIVRNPVFVKRVGYPLCKEDMIRNVMNPYDRTRIDEFIKHFGLSVNASYKGEIVYDRIVDALALGMLHNSGYGGNKRSLHTVERIEYKDYVGRVIDRKVVKTGTRIPGSGHVEDYEQPYLDDEKTHLLFMVEMLRPTDDSIPCFKAEIDCFWIESKNLEKPLVSL